MPAPCRRNKQRSVTRITPGAVIAAWAQSAGLPFSDFLPSAAMPVSPAFNPAPIDLTLDTALAEQRLVGCVVLVSQGGELVYRRAAGLADRESGRVLREDDLFRLASLTKPMVSVTALRLVCDGVLRLDDPVSRWLPDFRPALADGRVPEITVHHLLTHTAGLSYGFTERAVSAYERAGVSDGLDQPGLSLAENLRRIASVPLGYPPGEGWSYSVALDVLGGVMQAASGATLPELVARHVTEPLGMADTAFHCVDVARLVTPYQDNPAPHGPPLRMGELAEVRLGHGIGRFAPGRLFDPASFPSGGGGMTGTAPDFMHFLHSLHGHAPAPLPADTLALMQRDQTGPQRSAFLGPGWVFGYGWAILANPAKMRSPQSAGTLQWGGAYGHHWFYDLARDLAVVALTHTTFEGMAGAFPFHLRNAVYAAG